jgi:serine/threonine-protein kinase
LYTRVLAPPPAATVAVPSVLNAAKADAQTKIEAANLVYAEAPPQASADVPVGAVISQDPTAGAQVSVGSTVTVVLSSGADTVPVPDLAGLTQQQARDALKAAGLLVGNVTTQDSKDVARDRIISTNPPAGSELARDTEVSLVVSTGQVQLPDVVDMGYLEARDKLLELGLVVEPQYAENSTVDPDTVIGQDPQPGKVDQGSKVVLTVAKAAAPTTPATSTSSSSSSAPTVSPGPSESPSVSVTATP